MPTWVTAAQLDSELASLGGARLRQVVARSSRHQWSYPALLLAIGSRESWVTNIVGDGGHGRGAWQIDDRTWQTWLESVPGVRSGTWGPTIPGATARTAGMCPTLEDGVDQAIRVLHQGWDAALHAGVPTWEAARVMVAGYNCGPSSAIAGWRNHGQPDYYTTGANYSTDIMQRETVCHAFLKAHGFVALARYDQENTVDADTAAA